MNEDYFERRRNDFDEEDESIGYSPRHRRIKRRSSFFDFLSQRKTLIFAGAATLLIIILVALFSGENNELSQKDLTALSTRVDLLENRLTRLEEVELRIASLQEQENNLRQSLGETKTLITSLAQRVDELAQRLEAEGEAGTGVVKGTEAGEVETEKPVSPPKRRVHEVRRGETLYRIALKYGLTVDELCRLNNISPSQPIHPGQKLIIGRKGE
jgi:LysM repeat protein